MTAYSTLDTLIAASVKITPRVTTVWICTFPNPHACDLIGLRCGVHKYQLYVSKTGKSVRLFNEVGQELTKERRRTNMAKKKAKKTAAPKAAPKAKAKGKKK
jgi:hypothetical protein